MITEDYVSFETAKLLKEKGFDAEVKSFYGYDSEFKTWELEEDDRWDTPNNWGEYYLSAPTLQMAMKWLREVHKIGIFPSTYSFRVGKNRSDKHVYGTAIINLETYELMTNDMMPMPTYEGAIETAIKYCLENLI